MSDNSRTILIIKIVNNYPFFYRKPINEKKSGRQNWWDGLIADPNYYSDNKRKYEKRGSFNLMLDFRTHL